MTSNDAQIARQWAEAWAEEPTNDMLAAVYRHILATTTPLTMADIEWDDDVHAGLCAEHVDGDTVRMLGKEHGDDDLIYCHWTYDEESLFAPLNRGNLTPLPGTKIDLTPRREPESVPESAPDHPTALTTEEDYENAPKGTVVAMGAEAWTKTTENEWSDPTGRVDDKYMSSSVRRVLRWGWGA